MSERNEAADRLRQRFLHEGEDRFRDVEALRDLDAALAHERSAGAAPIDVIEHDHTRERRYVGSCADCRHNLTQPLMHERSAGAAPLDCDCVDLKAKLHLAVTALRGFEALYTEIIEGKEPSDDD